MLDALAVLVERFHDLVVALCPMDGIEVHHTTIHFRVDVHRSDRHQLQSVIIKFRKLVGNDLAQGFAQSRGALVPSAILSIRGATSMASHNNYAK